MGLLRDMLLRWFICIGEIKICYYVWNIKNRGLGILLRVGCKKDRSWALVFWDEYFDKEI